MCGSTRNLLGVNHCFEPSMGNDGHGEYLAVPRLSGILQRESADAMLHHVREGNPVRKIQRGSA